MKVLVVEDSPVDFEFMQMSLERNKDLASIDLTQETCGESGLVAAKTGSYDLVILDINLPRMNGLEVLKNLKSDITIQKLPVVMFTTSTWRDNIKTAYENGASIYVPKPTVHTDFFETFSSLLRFWLIHAKTP